ncbi:sulfotransferase family 2 domain-containing protein [Kordiimonas marina]|uniref:sulfotransferase family 2 domain-containing protein n=1 Tax=Kordiimonas marina TaxID=2872312 RepID=UPI001FF3F628|nr:sulfotransferase family 2 domain-containing protein [Kordiimonas marina]MCJ9430234.1 sulfotransferase family protein [Kordiimonas marina]
MPVVSNKYGLAYYSVPKIACTSMKHLFYFLDHGVWLNDVVGSGQKQNIHAVVKGEMPFRRADWEATAHLESFVIVRDPIQRFLSAYANRVLHHGELDRWRIKNGSLSLRRAPRPSLEDFVDYLEDYQADSEAILHHTRPLRHFLGGDLSRFNHVFRIEELDQVVTFLSRHTGLTLTLPHSQTGGPKLTRDRLSEKHLMKLRDYYAADYALLNGYYG